MADDNEEPNPVDQLVDLFVYAPVGLLYEYQDVLPKLVKRGKSQVQLAKVVGQMAMNRGNPADNFTVLAEGLAGVVAKQITELGSAIGLAPPQAGDEAKSDGDTPPPPSTADAIVVTEAVAAAEAVPEVGAGSATGPEDRPLPIARYDELKAKEIIELLDDLEPNQLERIRSHEEANRARKTVLGKLDRLAR